MNKTYHRRALRAAEKLNEGAYRHAVSIATKAQLRRAKFRPQFALETYQVCPRALILIEAAGKPGGHFGTAIAEAAATWCPCHPQVSRDGLLDLAFGDEDEG